MEKIPDFSINKDLHKAPEVDRTVKVLRRRGEKIPETKSARVDAYFQFLDRTTQRKEFAEPLKEKILTAYTLNTQDPEIVAKTAEGLYESEKRLAIAQGRGADIAKLEKAEDVVVKYKPLVFEKAEIQRKTLSSWLDYLQKNDAKHPMWFRYFVVRSLEKMGALDEDKGTYSKRTPTTVAPFPEMNSEALGWVFNRLTEGLPAELFVAKDSEEQENKEKILALIESKDFSKLYALALEETAGKFDRASIEGEWHTYKKGGNWKKLESDLKGKGTGWCTAEGSAKSHLSEGDFLVFFTKGEDGGFTQPRIAIRMQNDEIAEVRGVAKRQELEPALVEVAQKKYHNLPGGEGYDKKAEDMKLMTALVKKQEKGLQFTKSDLIFLYEINSKIEGFGYDDDPRIKELRVQRKPNLDEDLTILFDCTLTQIAHNQQQVNAFTKVYTGLLYPGIFAEKIPNILPNFPESRIKERKAVIGALRSAKETEKQLAQAKIQTTNWSKHILEKTPFSQKVEQLDLVELSVADLGFSNGATRAEIYKKALELGLELAPAEVGPALRLADTKQALNTWYYIGMEPIADAVGAPYVFNVDHDDDGLFLSADNVDADNHWNASTRFVFVRREYSS